MTSLHKLIEAKGSEWVDLHLRAKLEPRDLDREDLMGHLIDGMSPVLAAQKVHTSERELIRGYEGLVWLAYDVENQLYASLGEGIEALLTELKNNQEVEVSSSRVRRLENAANGAGLVTERVTILRLKSTI